MYDKKVYELGGAARDGKLDVVRKVVSDGVNVNGCVGYEGCERPVDFAARNGHLNVVKFLVNHGALINSSKPNSVFWAARYGNADVVYYLLSHGGRLKCDKTQLVSLKREMIRSGWEELASEVERTWDPS
jgi:ankyrin repeat protein